MTGSDILKRALALLGYSDAGGNPQLSERVTKRAVPLINLVYNDLRRISNLEAVSISHLNDEIVLPDRAVDIAVCGVASYVALSEGDDLMQAVWSAEYSRRRTTLSEVTEIENVLPKAY